MVVQFPSSKWAVVAAALPPGKWKILTKYKADGTPAYYWGIEVEGRVAPPEIQEALANAA